MQYQVSERIQNSFRELVQIPEVRAALAFLEKDQENSIKEQMEIAMIEAPSFHEQERAAYYAKKLENLTDGNAFIDERFNVESVYGAEVGKTILVEAHLDTVFPFGTVKEVKREGDRLYAPGIYDDARGGASVLAALRALRNSGLNLKNKLIVAGTTREETDLSGMREVLARHPEVAATVSVDGGFLERITYNATFYKAVEYTFHGQSGHIIGVFGQVANTLGAAARAIARIQEIRVPQTPKTTFSCSAIRTPAHCGVTAFPDSCTIYVSVSSDGQEEFRAVEKEIEACVHAACEEENSRWGVEQLTVTKEVVGQFPGGAQDPHAPIVEAFYSCARYLGKEPQFAEGGTTNGNIPISMGIPAVTVGGSWGRNLGVHSVEEWFPTTEAYKCPQGLLLLLLMLCGVEGGPDSCLDQRKYTDRSEA